MLLAVDIGNTQTVLGLLAGEQVVQHWRVRTDPRATADEIALLWRGLMAGAEIDGIAACSTVPAVLHEVRTVCSRYYADVPAVVVEPGVRTGVALLYDNPHEVGADRIVNTLAAFHLYGGPAVVVDFGTSTNFDVVSERGEFLGGALAPGIEISIDALAARGARLFKVELTRPRSVVGKSTVEALQSGLLYGFAGQVEGIVTRIAAELPAPPAVVATGGLAPLIIDECASVEHHQPWLTLIGLRLIFDRNRQRP